MLRLRRIFKGHNGFGCLHVALFSIVISYWNSTGEHRFTGRFSFKRRFCSSRVSNAYGKEVFFFFLTSKSFCFLGDFPFSCHIVRVSKNIKTIRRQKSHTQYRVREQRTYRCRRGLCLPSCGLHAPKER